MADNEQAAADEQAQAAEQQQPQFALQRLYIKDSSFEAPSTPQVFGLAWQPEVSLELNTKNQPVAEHVHEVVLTLTVTVKLGETTAFLAEVQQAGIFLIQGLEQQGLNQTLGAFCPNILFPYAREAIDNLVVKGSFPALMLAPVNFDALYAERVQRVQAEQAQQAAH